MSNSDDTLMRLADAGDVDAQLKLGFIYEDADNFVMAVKYYKLAAEQDNKKRSVQLGRHVLRRYGC